MLTENGKIQLEKLIATGNKIGLINTSKNLIEKELKLFHWEESYGILKTTVKFTDFEFIGFTTSGYYLKKNYIIFYTEDFEEEYLINNKKDSINLELKISLKDCK